MTDEHTFSPVPNACFNHHSFSSLLPPFPLLPLTLNDDIVLHLRGHPKVGGSFSARYPHVNFIQAWTRPSSCFSSFSSSSESELDLFRRLGFFSSSHLIYPQGPIWAVRGRGGGRGRYTKNYNCLLSRLLLSVGEFVGEGGIGGVG